MGRIYSVSFAAVAVTAVQDFFEINPPSTKSVIIHEARLSQVSDAGDAEDEMLQVSWIRGNTTSGSGGTTPTAAPLDGGDTAYGGTVEVNNTTVASAGTPVTLLSDCFNVRSGWIYVPTPECRIQLGGGVRLCLRLGAAPADSLTMSGTCVFESIG